jgi:DNA-binding transcriptional ArsR family regulator
MNVEDQGDLAAARIAAAIGEPARARMLYALMDGRARTSTELGTIAEVSPSTASIHLQRLAAERLVAVVVQGRYRYYNLRGKTVATVLEGLNVLSGGRHRTFVPTTPNRLRAARTCYDHMAGTAAVELHDRLIALGWLSSLSRDALVYDVTAKGTKAFESLGIDVAGIRSLRRRFAYGCLDWSERRPHVGGAVGAALLSAFLRKRWVTQDLDSRALSLTSAGRREFRARFGVSLAAGGEEAVRYPAASAEGYQRRSG